ncbi:MAG TPA: GAP family protein [Gaiellaceae bacterium]|nr:GAP family protein [Gaiellaceae bacterium]
MGTLILEVTALGVAVALTSPGSVVAVIALLSLSSGARRGLAFIVGWLIAIGIIFALVILVLQGQDFHSRNTSPSRAASAVEIFLGSMLLLVVAWMHRRPQHQPKNQSQPKWLGRVDSSHWLLEVVVGLVMLSYALTLTAAAETLKANVGSADAALAGLVFAVASIVTIAAPLVVVALAPERAARVLETWRNWVLAHSRSILLVALLVIGAALIAKGVYDLVAY